MLRMRASVQDSWIKGSSNCALFNGRPGHRVMAYEGLFVVDHDFVLAIVGIDFGLSLAGQGGKQHQA